MMHETTHSHPGIRRRVLLQAIVAALVAGACAVTSQAEPVIWSGRTQLFEKIDWADWTLPENQDRIRDGVWITRADGSGIFNLALEEDSDGNGGDSPLGTEWAEGDAVDWETLTYMSWFDFAGGSPNNHLIGVEGVVHLIEDDIYIDIVFESWTCCGQGGGFSYLRAPAPTPVDDTPRFRSTLRGNYPNPFNPETRIAFSLGRAQSVTLAIHACDGRRLAVLADGWSGSGEHEIAWAGTDDAGRSLPSGVYLARLEGVGWRESLRLVLLK